jgi:hypothetical protein
MTLVIQLLRGLDACGRQQILNMLNSGESFTADEIKEAIDKVAVCEGFDKQANADFIRQLQLAGHEVAAIHLEFIST